MIQSIVPAIVVPNGIGRSALDDLDLVPWASLGHAYGVGLCVNEYLDSQTGFLRVMRHSVPEYLWGLLSPLSQQRENALETGLFGTISHQGGLYQVTGYAIPFLVSLGADPKVPNRSAMTLGFLTFLQAALRRPQQNESIGVVEGFELSRTGLRAMAAAGPSSIVDAIRFLLEMLDKRPSMSESMEAEFDRKIESIGRTVSGLE